MSLENKPIKVAQVTKLNLPDLPEFNPDAAILYQSLKTWWNEVRVSLQRKEN